MPQISAIAATSSATSTVITWQTDTVVSSGAVAYGTTTAYSATSTSDAALDHSVVLAELEPATTYHFDITATAAGATVTSPDQMFTTPAAPPSVSGSPPAISMITVVPSYSMATISWTTDQLSSSEVWYGATSYDASSTGDAELAQIPTKDHVVTINGLSPDTTYHFVVVSRNASGAAATSKGESFTTGSV